MSQIKRMQTIKNKKMDKFKTPKICIGNLMPDKKSEKENHLKIEQENLQL